MVKLDKKYLRREGETVFFNGDHMNIYIPTSTFKRKLSKFNGIYIETIGIFIFEILTNKQYENNEPGVFHTMKFPNPINFTYSGSFKYKGKLINGKINNDEYNVYQLAKNDIFMANVNTAKSSDSLIRFVTAFNSGAIPNIIPYEELVGLFMKSMELNGSDLKNPAVIFELIISEVCRSRTDKSVSFREEITGKKEYNPYGYSSTNLTQIPILSSTFAALSFQDMDEAIIASVERNLTGKPEKHSPIERSIKY